MRKLPKHFVAHETVSLLPLREKVDRDPCRETDEGEGSVYHHFDLSAPHNPLIRPYGAPSPARGEGRLQFSEPDEIRIPASLSTYSSVRATFSTLKHSITSPVRMSS